MTNDELNEIEAFLHKDFVKDNRSIAMEIAVEFIIRLLVEVECLQKEAADDRQRNFN